MIILTILVGASPANAWKFTSSTDETNESRSYMVSRSSSIKHRSLFNNGISRIVVDCRVEPDGSRLWALKLVPGFIPLTQTKKPILRVQFDQERTIPVQAKLVRNSHYIWGIEGGFLEKLKDGNRLLIQTESVSGIEQMQFSLKGLNKKVSNLHKHCGGL